MIKRTPAKTYNGFAIQMQSETDLGLAMLIVEDEEANYEPIAVAANIREGKEDRAKRSSRTHAPSGARRGTWHLPVRVQALGVWRGRPATHRGFLAGDGALKRFPSKPLATGWKRSDSI